MLAAADLAAAAMAAVDTANPKINDVKGPFCFGRRAFCFVNKSY
jgi:hypothetical protein